MRRLAVLLALAAACAGRLPQAGRPLEPPAAGTLEGWRALTDGRGGEARRLLSRSAAAGPDALALFGRMELGVASGDASSAAGDALALLELASRDGASEWALLAAGPAVIRLAQLLEELSAGREAIEDRALAIARGGLPWPARLGLARLGDAVARRRGDADLRERMAERAGCVKHALAFGSLGRLPRLDLEAPLPRWPEAPRRLADAGCALAFHPTGDRPSAELLRAEFVAPVDGDYDVLVAYPGELRVAVDGGVPVGAGSELELPARQVAVRFHLRAGTHLLDLRLAAMGGRAQITAIVTGRNGPVQFRSPSRGTQGAAAAGERLAAAPAPVVAPGPAALAAALAMALTAVDAGEVEVALGLAAELQRARRFALGLHAAAAIVLADPTRPPALARDAARGLLRTAANAQRDLARVWQQLALTDLEEERGREAVEHATEAAAAAPGWWPAQVVLARSLRARGLEHDADAALDRAIGGACPLVEELLRRAERRRRVAEVAELSRRLGACDAESEALTRLLRDRGDLVGAERELRRRLAVAADEEPVREELASVLLARGDAAGAVRELQPLVDDSPRNPTLRLRLVDALLAAGQRARAESAVRAALQVRPDSAEIRRGARTLGIPLPLDHLRLDGRDVIRAFAASGRRYDAPAVVVLDRTVVAVMPDGTQLVLTHNIVRVQSKDGVERWGEVQIPSGAEVLTLRTHKADGSTREPEEIVGKETVSAPDLHTGDYVEWETMESRAAPDAFPGGFLGDRFYFRSFDGPLDRSELLVQTPAGMALDVDRRAGAPAPLRERGASGTVLTVFRAAAVPQLFAERSAVPPDEYVPSVRVSSGLSWTAWTRFVLEQLAGTTRSSPDIRRAAAEIRARAGARRKDADDDLAGALVEWVTSRIEAGGDLREPASWAVVRGRGNRLAPALALARALGLRARPVLARGRNVAPDEAEPVPVELDDFGEMLLRLDLNGGPVWVDLRLRHAPVGYLPPALDGARVLSLDDASFGRCQRRGSDRRAVAMTVKVDAQGAAAAEIRETLSGWPALEIAELQEQVGADSEKLRREFEQRWVAVQFPGAGLVDLKIDIGPPGARLRYVVRAPRLGVVDEKDGVRRLKIAPVFFRSQPGRRYAAEPSRTTALLAGYDVPVEVDATIELPPGGRLVSRPENTVVPATDGKGGYRFVEERRSSAPDRLQLRRAAAMPIMRVPPERYGDLARDLRRVDGAERAEILVELPRAETP